MKEESKKSVPDKIKELEEELSKTKYNKRTQFHIGLVKAKIARLKEKQLKRRSVGKGAHGYSVRKAGDASVILIGFPSVGKSTLLNNITKAKSEVGSYDFTTLEVIPGLLEHNYAKIQILDVPGVVEGAASGRGRGKEVLACAVNADLVLVLVDVFNTNVGVIKKEIHDSNLRVNEEKPDVKIVKKSRGGIDVGATVKLNKIDDRMVTAILKEFRISNADVVIRSDITPDQFIDVIEGNKRYIPGMVVLNKIDMVSEKELEKIKKKVKPDISVSADKRTNLGKLKELIFKKLKFIRIYCKEVGKKADLDEPLIMFKNSTLRDMCLKLHKDFVDKFKFSRIWGKSSKFPGQIIRKLEHELIDGDIVEIHLK